ncbi:MAG: hypothetical protein GX442_19990 [Candidatus Riflebacteria bacterium]|nr:hypothetical protein [Candidatus Riflebacteria bacterium]
MNHPFHHLLQKARQNRSSPWHRSSLSSGTEPRERPVQQSFWGSLLFSLVFSLVFTGVILALAWAWNPVDLFHSASGVVWTEVLALGGVLFGLAFLISLPLAMLFQLRQVLPDDEAGLPTSEA